MNWKYSEDIVQEPAGLAQARAHSLELGIDAVTPAVGAQLGVLAAASGARSIVEIGTGAGVSGLWMLRGAPGATITSIDTEVEFIDHLRGTIDDPRLIAVHGSARDAQRIVDDLGAGGADCVLSGIPFSTIDPETGDAIVACAARMLRPGGLFMAYQVKLTLEPMLHRHFDEVERARQWLNVPPFHLWWARNDAA
jgi:predicted O-methyltransferase YrrM